MGEFETGLTINVTRLKKGNAQERTPAYLALFAQTPGNELLDAREKEMGVLEGIRGRIRRTEKNRAPVLMEVLSVGNSRTNTVYLFFFESPEASWERAWSKGEQILKLFLRLNDGVLTRISPGARPDGASGKRRGRPPQGPR